MKRVGIITALLTLLTVVSASVALAATTINPANAPSGTHLQSGAIGCSVGSDNLTVSCTAFELAGVGNTNAELLLTATYSGRRRLPQSRRSDRGVARDDLLGHQ
jgi:hypothetical protein